MIFAILFAWLGYKRATAAGKNGILWGFLAAITFIGSQLIVNLAVGVFMGIGVGIWGWSESIFDKYELIVNIFAVALSFVTGFLVIKVADKNPTQEVIDSPPPPPKFDVN